MVWILDFMCCWIISKVPGVILGGIAMHLIGRRGPAFMFHLLVGVFMSIVATIHVFGPTTLTSGLNIFSQVSMILLSLSFRFSSHLLLTTEY